MSASYIRMRVWGGELGGDHFVQESRDGGWVYVGETEIELGELDRLGEG